MLGTNVGPALVSAVAAYAVEAIRRREYGMYSLVNAAEIFVTSWAGNSALMWLPSEGFIGLGGTVTSAAIAGALYAVARRYIQQERDVKLNNFAYGAAFALAGELIAAPVFAAIGTTSLNIGDVEINVGATERRSGNTLPASNTNTPPGSATPANAPRMGAQAYSNPCYWL